MSDEETRAWRDPDVGEHGRNVLADDFDPEMDAAHPDRFKELWDEDPRKSAIKPGGAMWTYVVDGRPGVRGDAARGDE